ncbi:Pyridoxal phosphate homeostasis protein [Stieleria bergensis]|uniref:Pyridoxal phosphate homeostasis protein n=1 Tax=Stieleria bergensis TaxID=2528025 RepID=A0A517SQ39_9BACT|nr:MAG: YggS family pyridoxal phosphate enzyme [Rhodopirellula sp. TMED11]QDT58237.1 Pyridoxal phosphate homeostasis protein [Planctomycetes bacterium SV_7m_r]
MTSQSQSLQQITDNWQHVSANVKAAAKAAGRDPESVTLVGVTKYVDASLAGDLVTAGCHDLGENRPQMLWSKAESLAELGPITWHMIGHVQTNKLRRMLRYRPLIHSVDSPRLLEAIEQESEHQQCTTDVLLEVNISGDAAKTGLAPETVKELLKQSQSQSVRVMGLMAMSGLGSDQNAALQQFQQVAQLRDDLQQSTGIELPELSMGMSGDYEQAIQAGATLVRIGSALFAGLLDR